VRRQIDFVDAPYGLTARDVVVTAQRIVLSDANGEVPAVESTSNGHLYRVPIQGTMLYMQPSDVLILFALLNQDEPWTLRSLAARLGVKHSKVQRALDRLAEADVYDADRRRGIPHAAEELLEHALKYLHPVRLGPVARGVPTAWAAPPLSGEIVDSELPPVWPTPNGKVRGQSVTPLDKQLPSLADTWPEVAELAALTDAVRLGDARSRSAARKHLHERIYA
jgi:predicted transcriptional regulator